MRLFTAIEPPSDQLPAVERLCQGIPGVRWSTPYQLHLTLVFIGEVADDLLEPIADALGRIDFNRFELRCREIGFFRSGALWLGVAPSQSLSLLQQKQRLALNHIPRVQIQSRRFHPHWTLGRFRRRQQPDLSAFIDRHRSLDISIPVDRFVLKSSRLFSQGAQHRSEYEFLAE
ncbi:RNA 2',3'-cyclic phosphodiesterase [Motiliproteus sp.]|uniref:RNA 2',3'-cyclic phosphodiesterase n=1 Tax=Motiliproteus sp. TaxID=1898955 RepID=UPI003BA96DE6